MTNKIRTEEEILKDFEELGYEVIEDCETKLILKCGLSTIQITKLTKVYRKLIGQQQNIIGNFLTMQEHKLLHELFICWGWL